MREVLVAVFDTAPHADEAVRALEANNVPSSAIRRYRRDDPAIPGGATDSERLGSRHPTAATMADQPSRTSETAATSGAKSGGGFWSWLTGDEGSSEWRDPNYAETDEDYYSRSAQAGNTVVAVHVEAADADRVMRLLADQSPLGLEDRGADRLEGGAGRETDTGRTGQVIAGRAHDAVQHTERGGEQTIPLSEERVDIGKQRVDKPVHVRRFVTQRPVEQQINLRDERVEVERRRPVEGTTPGAGAFQERTVEVHESHEEPTVSKTAQVAEEVVVRKESQDRTATVRDTARKESVEVDRDDKTAGRDKTTGRDKPAGRT